MKWVAARSKQRRQEQFRSRMSGGDGRPREEMRLAAKKQGCHGHRVYFLYYRLPPRRLLLLVETGILSTSANVVRRVGGIACCEERYEIRLIMELRCPHAAQLESTRYSFYSF